MEYKGTIHQISDTQTVSQKFKKRSFVVTDNHEKYPQFISFDLTQDRCMVLDSFSVGDNVEVIFNLKGREWQGKDGIKYFNTLEAFKVKSIANRDMGYGSPDDDLPF